MPPQPPRESKAVHVRAYIRKVSPRRSREQTRSLQILLRVTPEEKGRYEAAAGVTSLSKWLRGAAEQRIAREERERAREEQQSTRKKETRR
jgi:hypothetical protein